MAVIPLPATPIRWRDASFRLLRADAVQEYVSGATQVTAYSKAIWAGTWELPPLFADEAGEWRARLAQLSSYANTFEAGPPGYAGPTAPTPYTGNPNPLVNGAGQLGLSLACDGMVANRWVMRRGDYFHVVAAGQKELKILTSPVVANAAGQAVFSFQPALRNAPADNAAVEIFAPVAAFRLAAPQFAASFDLNRAASLALDAVEAFVP